MSSVSLFAKNEFEDSTSRLSRKEIKRIFRTGNKLLAKAVNYVTCPLGDCNGHISKFEAWIEDQPERIMLYFDQTFYTEQMQAMEKYNRPYIKGRDGQWWSESDMDRAMMYGG